MEQSHVAPREARVPESGQGGSWSIMCCRGQALAGASHSMASPHEGRGWYQGCPSVAAHIAWEDPVEGSLSPKVELGVTATLKEKVGVWDSSQQFLIFAG